MNVKKLRNQVRELEVKAAEKIAEIKADTSMEDATRIEREHAGIMSQIAVLERAIKKAAKKDDEEDTRDGSDDEPEGDDDNDDDDDKPAKGKRNVGDAGTVLSRAAIIELGLVFSQARDLGADLGDVAEAISKNETPDTARKRMFSVLAEKSKNGGPEGSVQVIRDEKEGVSDAMTLALTNRILAGRGASLAMDYAPKGASREIKREAKWVEDHRAQAEQYMSMGLVELAARAINYRGRNNFLTQGDAAVIFERAFNTTSDFPSIFQNALNKALLARYQLHTPTYREIAAERTFVDFRPHPQVRAGDFPTLQPVTETGELKYGSTTDNNEPISVQPYGVVFTISRTMLVNDDLGAIDQILGSAGDMVLVFENTTFYNTLLSNPTLNQDSTAVFASGHNNLASVGADPSVATIGAGRSALRAMKTISGNLINVAPSIILTGPLQETNADTMVASITPTLTTSVNPFSGRLRSVSDANIPDNSWYLFSEAGRVPTFIYGFLAGTGGPRTRTYEPFGVQGVKVSLEHDFGTGAIDYRGAYKVPSH